MTLDSQELQTPSSHLQLDVLLADAVAMLHCVTRRAKGVHHLLQGPQMAGHLKHQPLCIPCCLADCRQSKACEQGESGGMVAVQLAVSCAVWCFLPWRRVGDAPDDLFQLAL